uniref:Uncharacterized protein n=1 Tax=Craspedostauros australis TaxID=1486917 RepID=A0A7R9WN76_9STRA|mmetsp:Transcript_12823/g.35408  ORF Transcript_12823/g.35408 Transcript_12823/m.35408 type:complete len:154 (+) Transcript_12823:486-947(+)
MRRNAARRNRGLPHGSIPYTGILSPALMSLLPLLLPSWSIQYHNTILLEVMSGTFDAKEEDVERRRQVSNTKCPRWWCWCLWQPQGTKHRRATRARTTSYRVLLHVFGLFRVVSSPCFQCTNSGAFHLGSFHDCFAASTHESNIISAKHVSST